MHHHLVRSLLVLSLIALFPAFVASAAEVEAAVQPVDAAAELAVEPGCDSATATAGTLDLGGSLEAFGDATQGAQDKGNCWQEYRTTYSCSCLNDTRARHHYEERICCPWAGCGGWSEYGSSCSGTICAP